jgi:integrase
VTGGQLDLITPAGLGVRDKAVSKTTAQRLYDSVPPNTRRAYARAWDGRPHPDAEPPTEPEKRGFIGWCELTGRNPMPATPETLADYVSFLCDRDLAPATIEQAIAAIRTRHRLAGHGRHQPDGELALAVLKVHRRDRAGRGLSGQRRAVPVVVENLRKMVDTIDPNSLLGLRDHALLLYGICVFGRRSELSELRWTDLTDAEEGMRVRIRMSKTDQDAKGESIPVLWGTFPGTDPLAVTKQWREAVASRGAVEGPLLRGVDRHGRLLGRLHPKNINDALQRRALLAGLGEGYSAHSLRAGAATIAYMNGAPISTICKLGRWKENSPVVLGYIRSVDEWKDHPFRGVL